MSTPTPGTRLDPRVLRPGTIRSKSVPGQTAITSEAAKWLRGTSGDSQSTQGDENGVAAASPAHLNPAASPLNEHDPDANCWRKLLDQQSNGVRTSVTSELPGQSGSRMSTTSSEGPGSARGTWGASRGRPSGNVQTLNTLKTEDGLSKMLDMGVCVQPPERMMSDLSTTTAPIESMVTPSVSNPRASKSRKEKKHPGPPSVKTRGLQQASPSRKNKAPGLRIRVGAPKTGDSIWGRTSTPKTPHGTVIPWGTPRGPDANGKLSWLKKPRGNGNESPGGVIGSGRSPNKPNSEDRELPTYSMGPFGGLKE